MGKADGGMVALTQVRTPRIRLRPNRYRCGLGMAGRRGGWPSTLHAPEALLMLPLPRDAPLFRGAWPSDIFIPKLLLDQPRHLQGAKTKLQVEVLVAVDTELNCPYTPPSGLERHAHKKNKRKNERKKHQKKRT